MELTGTASGEYTLITTYADQNDVQSSERTGVTNAGKQEQSTLTINSDGTYEHPPLM